MTVMEGSVAAELICGTHDGQIHRVSSPFIYFVNGEVYCRQDYILNNGNRAYALHKSVADLAVHENPGTSEGLAGSIRNMSQSFTALGDAARSLTGRLGEYTYLPGTAVNYDRVRTYLPGVNYGHVRGTPANHSNCRNAVYGVTPSGYLVDVSRWST